MTGELSADARDDQGSEKEIAGRGGEHDHQTALLGPVNRRQQPGKSRQ
jgi:hypothetical protein